MLVSDHGDMLGNHNLWAKPPMFEWSARIPMILMPTADCDRYNRFITGNRLAELRDVMPTLLELCDHTDMVVGDRWRGIRWHRDEVGVIISTACTI